MATPRLAGGKTFQQHRLGDRLHGAATDPLQKLARDDEERFRVGAMPQRMEATVKHGDADNEQAFPAKNKFPTSR